MRVFVTGGTGYVGAAVVSDLVRAGHQVTGLARSTAARARLAELGAAAVEGSLSEVASYRDAAASHEAIVHMAFDYGAGAAAVEADRAAACALLDAARLGGRTRALVFTSGVWVLGDTGGRAADEGAPTRPFATVAWRPGHERLVLDGATGSLATAVIRPGLVYGGAGGLLGPLFASAEREGASTVVGEGRNHWPLVHREDLALLYRRVVETAACGVFHGVDGQPLPAATVGRAASEAAGKGGKVRSVPVEEARKTMGPVADALAMDQIVVTRRASEVGWRPARASFVDAAGAVYREWKAGSR